MTIFVVFDTNIFDHNFSPNSGDWQTYRAIARKLKLRSALPWVVMEELVRHTNNKTYPNNLNRAMKSIFVAIKELKSGISMYEGLDLSLYHSESGFKKSEFRFKDEAGIRKALIERLNKTTGYKPKILALPTISHRETMEWCLNNKPPFTQRVVPLNQEPCEFSDEDNQTIKNKNQASKHKDAGYKDFLIWKSIIDLLGESDDNQVIYITADNDYRKKDKDKSGLHEHLEEDLSQVLDGANRFEIYKSVGDFIAKKSGVLSNVSIEKLDFSEFDVKTWRIQPPMLNDFTRAIMSSDMSHPTTHNGFRIGNPVLLTVEQVEETNKHLWIVHAQCSQIYLLYGSVNLPDGTIMQLPEIPQSVTEEVIFTYDFGESEITNATINKILFDEVCHLEVTSIPRTEGYRIILTGALQMNLQERVFESEADALLCLQQLLSAHSQRVGRTIFTLDEVQSFSKVPIPVAVIRKWGFFRGMNREPAT